MKTAILLIGGPGTGKSHFLRKNKVREIFDVSQIKGALKTTNLVVMTFNAGLSVTDDFIETCYKLKINCLVVSVPDDQNKRKSFYAELYSCIKSKS